MGQASEQANSWILPAAYPTPHPSPLFAMQLVVGPDGSEQYGIKRKHVLRGTRFSLPKPRVRAM